MASSGTPKESSGTSSALSEHPRQSSGARWRRIRRRAGQSRHAARGLRGHGRARRGSGRRRTPVSRGRGGGRMGTFWTGARGLSQIPAGGRCDPCSQARRGWSWATGGAGAPKSCSAAVRSARGRRNARQIPAAARRAAKIALEIARGGSGARNCTQNCPGENCGQFRIAGPRGQKFCSTKILVRRRP